MNAGWRGASAPSLYFATKTVLALVLPALLMLAAATLWQLQLSRGLFPLLLAGAAFGYYLPNVVLAARSRDIFENFRDALDLLTVCVEAGLSLERALAKVAGEIHIKSAALAQELQLVLMEMRAGFSKEKALRNLALRSGVEDVDTLVAMLIQSERFGTSMGESLRAFGESACQAQCDRGGSSGQDRAETIVPAGVLHLPHADAGADRARGDTGVSHAACHAGQKNRPLGGNQADGEKHTHVFTAADYRILYDQLFIAS
jgi:hypothetical protein